MRGASVNYSAKLLRKVSGILRRTPNTGDAVQPTAALVVVVGAIHLPPCMRTSQHHLPSVCLRMIEHTFDVLMWMLFPSHGDDPPSCCEGCQVTTDRSSSVQGVSLGASIGGPMYCGGEKFRQIISASVLISLTALVRRFLSVQHQMNDITTRS